MAPIAPAIFGAVLGGCALVLFAGVSSRAQHRPAAADMAGVARAVAAVQLALALVVVVVRRVAQETGRRDRDFLPPARGPWHRGVRTRLGEPMASVLTFLVTALPIVAAVYLYAGVGLGRLAVAEGVTVATAFVFGAAVKGLGAVVRRPRIVIAGAAASGVALFLVVASLGGESLFDPRGGTPRGASAVGAAAPAGPSQTHAGVSVTAVPRWGFATPGAITPYLVTVNNAGPSDVAGDVVLFPATSPTPSPSRAPLNDNGPPAPDGAPPEPALPEPGRPGPPPKPAKPEVLALGQTEFTVAPDEVATAAPGDHLAYRAPVTLAAGGGEKSLILMVVEAPYGYRAELRDGSDRVMAESAPPAPPTPAAGTRYAVALLSQVPRADATLGWLADFFGPRTVTVTALGSVRDLPDDALMLSGLHSLVLAGFDTAELSPSQIRAIQGFVAMGGSLVLGGGSSGKQAASSLPDELVPVPPSGTASASLAALADLVGRTTTSTATVVTGDLRSGRSVLTTGEGLPLVVQADYGAGLVVQLAYDPLAEPFSSDPALRDLAWQQGISRGLARAGTDSGSLAAPAQLWSPALRRPPWPNWPRWGLALLVPYALLVGALGHRAHRAPKRAVRARTAALLAAVVFTAAVFVTSASRHGAVLPVVEVSTSLPDSTVLHTSYGGFQSVGGGNRRLEVAPGAVVSTVFTTPGPQGPVVVAVSPPAPRGGVLTTANGAGHVDLETGPGEARNLQRSSVERRPGLEAHLRLTGAGPPEKGGLRIVGAVTNRSSKPLRLLRAQLPEGALAQLADVLPPGATIEVDAPFVWPGRIIAGSGLRASQDELTMFAAASRAFTRRGQVVVAGLAPPGKGDPASIGVHLRVVPLEAMENLLAWTGQSQLVSSAAEPSGALVRVLDLGGVPGIGPVSVTFNAYQPGPEVFDWTARTWRAVPIPEGFERHAPLAASEVSDGLVRMRWTYDAVTWGGAGYGLALRRP